MSPKSILGPLDQQKIVLALSLALLLLFSLALDGFANVGNILSLLQSSAIIGVLGVVMAIVIIGRGIDLSMIAVLVMPVAWMFVEVRNGMPTVLAFGLALLIAVFVGTLNGWLVAYLEIPSIFATLASGTIVYGTMQFMAVSDDIVQIPAQLKWINVFFQGVTLGAPNVILFFVVIAALAWLFLRNTAYGRYVYAIGDNPVAARTTGIPIRPIVVLQYVISALVALVAGIVLSATVDSVNTRLFNSTMIYDVILVVVLGGIGLGGGKGSVSNVVVGTVLIGILINGMTMMNLSFVAQNLIKASILLVAIVIDNFVNPRDEQTSQQGDI